jgi:D-alanine-D-alanine ligase
VKPRGEGSSVGITRAADLAELERGIDAALAYDDSVLVERFVRGMEVTVGLLDGRVLGSLEIAPKSGIYDYAAKYTAGATEYILPPRLAPTRARGILNLAERAARALGCTGACRVDLLVTEGENEYVLEVNTLPGMTPTSLLPKIAAAAGIDYAALCESILASARRQSRNRSFATSAKRASSSSSRASPIASSVRYSASSVVNSVAVSSRSFTPFAK